MQSQFPKAAKFIGNVSILFQQCKGKSKKWTSMLQLIKKTKYRDLFLPAAYREGCAAGSWWWITDVTTGGTELVIELGGASIPGGCKGGNGGGGPTK